MAAGVPPYVIFIEAPLGETKDAKNNAVWQVPGATMYAQLARNPKNGQALAFIAVETMDSMNLLIDTATHQEIFASKIKIGVLDAEDTPTVYKVFVESVLGLSPLRAGQNQKRPMQNDDEDEDEDALYEQEMPATKRRKTVPEKMAEYIKMQDLNAVIKKGQHDRKCVLLEGEVERLRLQLAYHEDLNRAAEKTKQSIIEVEKEEKTGFMNANKESLYDILERFQ